MRPIDSNLHQSLQEGLIRPAMCVWMDLGGNSVAFTTSTKGLVVNGQFHSPNSINIDNIVYSTISVVNSVRITVDDIKQTVYLNLITVGLLGEFSVEIRYVTLDENFEVIGEMLLFKGFVTQWEYSPRKVSVTAASPFSKWAQVTTRQFSGSCRWKKFRGEGCGYGGSVVTCDRTYTTCKNLRNESNYGGFRWLPSMIGLNLLESGGK